MWASTFLTPSTAKALLHSYILIGQCTCDRITRATAVPNHARGRKKVFSSPKLKQRLNACMLATRAVATPESTTCLLPGQPKSEADIEKSQRMLRAAQMPACVAAQRQQHAVQWQIQIARSAQTPTCAGAKANKTLSGCRLPGLCPTWCAADCTDEPCHIPEALVRSHTLGWGHLIKSSSFLQQFPLLQERQALALTYKRLGQRTQYWHLVLVSPIWRFPCNQCHANGTIQVTIDD